MIKPLVLLLLVSAASWSQTIKGVFTSTPLKGAGEQTELPESAKKPIYYTYIYSNGVSLQKMEALKKIEIDTVNIESLGRINQRTDSLINATNLFHYKNLKEDVYRLDFNQNNRDISIRDGIPQYSWNLVEGAKSVAGYTCKNAIATTVKAGKKQNLVAWYCEEIPINDGLMDFSGLPGLILEVEINDQTRISFEKIAISPTEIIHIPEPHKTRNSVTIKEYEKMIMGNR